MLPFDAAHALAIDVMTVKNEGALADLLREVCACLGCDFFRAEAIMSISSPIRSAALRIHNYPEEWARWFDEQGLGLTDPIHPREPADVGAISVEPRAAVGAAASEDERVRAEARPATALPTGSPCRRIFPAMPMGRSPSPGARAAPDLGDLPLAGMIGPSNT